MRFSNDDPLLIGAHGLSASDPGSSPLRLFESKIGFVEIWDEVLDTQYAMDRYNNGNPDRAGGPAQL